MAIIRGTDGNDILIGSSLSDRISGLGGDDEIDPGLGGDDLIDGGSGVDTYLSFGGIVSLVDGSAREIGQSTATLVSIENVTGADTAIGDDGPNRFVSAFRVVGPGVEYSGNGGDDVLVGSAGADTLDGGDGADLVRGLGGIDLLIGGDGEDRLFGGEGDDVLQGGDGNDQIIDGAGRNRIQGGAGDDELRGTGRIEGGDGHDVIQALLGSTVLGGAGRDRVQASPEADRIRYLDRDDAPASFTAGPGEPLTYETIVGFDGAAGDRIDLRAIDADPGRDGDQAFRFVGTDTVDQPDEVGIVTLDVAVYLAVGGGPAGSASMLIHLDGLVGTLTTQHLRL
jgi:Ca2+-binding RTX toxin-like protein